jgi:23S rRNA (uracil1939-C5)-methyltransferase
MEKNQEFTVSIEDMSEDGAGIGKLDGYIWFIKDAVIGDVVRARAMKMKKNYGFARLMEILTSSEARVEPKCPVARQCGGCQLQAMSYEEQLKFKERKVKNHLLRIGKFKEDEIHMLPIMGMKEPWRYRNKAQFPFGLDKNGNIVAGFYAGRTHDIIECEDCLLGVEENKDILGIIKGFMRVHGIRPYDETTHKGLVRHALIRKGFHSGEIMVCLVINGKDIPAKEQLVEELCQVKGMTSISYSINQEKTNVIMGKEIVNLYGPGYITDNIGNVTYQISPLSFYQVNPVQTEKLYGTALEYAGLTGNETVWDLYCGIGTISLFLAQNAKKVYGVEIVPQAIEDARRNAALNNITNAEFFTGKAEEVLPEQYEKNKVYADVIVVDPPRKGCDQVCLDTILKMAPKRVVYVSCDSSTLARDLRYLADGGYEVEKVRCCDMFGQSCHVETVVLLTQQKPDDTIEIDLDLDELDATSAELKATYQEIKDYVLKEFGLKVSSLYISQVKRKCGIEVGENYNLPKSENARVPQCPKEKEEAIKAALKYFAMI